MLHLLEQVLLIYILQHWKELEIIVLVVLWTLVETIINIRREKKKCRESREWLNSKMGPALIWDYKAKEFINGPKIPHNNDTNDTND